MPSSARTIVPFRSAATARSRSTGRSACGSSILVKRYAETLRTEGTAQAYGLSLTHTRIAHQPRSH